MKKYFIILLLLLSCSSSPIIYKIPDAIQKKENIIVGVGSFNDKTGLYVSDYQIEQKVSEYINRNFRGYIVQNTKHKIPPRLHKAQNPFTSIILNKSPTVSPDIIIEGDIETIYFGNQRPDLAGSLLFLGLIGAVVEDSNSRNTFIGMITVKTRIIKAKTGQLLEERKIGGYFASKNKDATMYEILNKAVENYSQNTIDALSEGEY